MGYQPGKGLGKNAQGGSTTMHNQDPVNMFMGTFDFAVSSLYLVACFFLPLQAL